jgi:hypothetical protein
LGSFWLIPGDGKEAKKDGKEAKKKPRRVRAGQVWVRSDFCASIAVDLETNTDLKDFWSRPGHRSSSLVAMSRKQPVVFALGVKKS